MSLRKNENERIAPSAPADPKMGHQAASDQNKDSDDRLSRDEPMTGAQAACLRTLSEDARDLEAFDATLTKAEASRRIDALRAKLGRERDSGVDRLPRT